MAPLEFKNFGYARDPYKKPDETPDKLYATELGPGLIQVAKGDVDLREYATSTAQLNLPSCVGNAAADSIEILSAAQGYPKVELSRMFVWTLARNLMAREGYRRKTGTFTRNAFQALHKFGICLEEDWPYDTSKWDRLPSLTAMRKASGRKIKGYYRIEHGKPSTADMIIEALRAQHPVVFGTLLDSQWRRYDGKSTIRRPRGLTRGGHAMVCVGYDSQRGFIIKNSWGSWGDNGYAYMSEDYMTWKNTWDIWVPTTGHNFKPQRTP